MKRPYYLLLAILTFVLSIGCCRNSLDPQTALSGPQLAHQINRTTVALVDDFGSVNDPYCTGVWIASDTILTAYHCLTGYIQEQHQYMVGLALLQMGAPLEAIPLLSTLVPEPDDHSGVAEAIRRANSLFPLLKMDKTTFYYSVSSEAIDFNQSPSLKHPMTVLASYPSYDLALFRVSGPTPPHLVASLATTSPLVGETVALVGQTQRYWFSYKQLTVSAYRQHMAIDTVGPFMELVGNMLFGDSGSGIFNQQGQLVGIGDFINTSTNYGYSISLEHIRQVLLGQHLITGHLDLSSDPDLATP